MSAMTGGVDGGAEGQLVPAGPPPALRWNLWATVAWSALTVLANLVLFGQRPFLRQSLIDANAKAAKPVAGYTGARVERDVHSQLVGGLIEALLVVVILVLLAALVWRGRRWARWVLLALAVIGIPFRVGVVAQLAFGALVTAPAVYKMTLVAAGVASLLVVVLMLHRTTREYFAALRETQRGNLPAVPGARRPGVRQTGPRPPGARPAGGGLGALFAPRRRPTPPSPARPDGGATAIEATGATGTADAAAGDLSIGGRLSRRGRPTRPGSVKAKGSGPRPGRSKSRQQ